MLVSKCYNIVKSLWATQIILRAVGTLMMVTVVTGVGFLFILSVTVGQYS